MKLTAKGAPELKPTGPAEMFEYDFMRCHICGRLITKPECVEAMNPDGKTPGVFCPCGSNKVRPTNPRFHEYFLPRVIRFALLRLRGVM